ncbi:helix-turn-helix domain-containing protein [Burkholderia cenocepacia]|nr:helix-turn-helix domain-containing protein [Burkholderia cenocepacia]MBJ9920128.1 helix-turn-helix domain-containing protein [Burkholderia cenocepacia]RQU24799.1 helix-turn-helix domain-containing protein [Burkholderia cenocepacia]
MRTLLEIGQAVATRRRALGLKQLDVAKAAGVTAESLSRFERGRTTEFGSRKLLAVLAAVGMELDFVESNAWNGALLRGGSTEGETHRRPHVSG